MLEQLLDMPDMPSHDTKDAPQKHARIAVSVSGEVFLMEYLPDAPEWLEDALDDLGGARAYFGEFEESRPMGVYDIVFSWSYCGGNRCGGYPCAGDCGELDYEVVGEAPVIQWDDAAHMGRLNDIDELSGEASAVINPEFHNQPEHYQREMLNDWLGDLEKALVQMEARFKRS